MLASMGRLRWVPAAVVCLLATWYGAPVQLRISAAVVVLAWTVPIRPKLLGLIAAFVSLLASVWAWQTLDHTFLDPQADAGKVLFWATIEGAGLAALGARLAYAGHRRHGLLLLLPAAAMSLRLLPGAPAPQQLFLAGLAATAVGTAVLLGVYLNTRARAEAAAVEQARAEQRHLLAADLHDYVAHDVAAISVLAQSMRLANEPDVPPAMALIEQAAARALRRLDRSVALLRTDPGPARPLHRVADIAELVADYPLPVTFTSSGDVASVPAAVQETAHRVVTEALTNIGRHAPYASVVDVSLIRDELQLHVVVINDLPAQPGTDRGAPAGTGLAALTERVRSLGGDLRAGADGPRWTVAASLPLT
jgi:signal transduction histidine kinase